MSLSCLASQITLSAETEVRRPDFISFSMFHGPKLPVGASDLRYRSVESWLLAQAAVLRLAPGSGLLGRSVSASVVVWVQVDLRFQHRGDLPPLDALAFIF